jgi:hypothetical protein
MNQSSESTQPGYCREGDFTLAEDPEPGNRGLAVRPVAREEKKVVWRWGGYLFVTATEAEEFAKAEMVFHPDDPPHARQAFRTSAWTGSASMCTSEASEDKAGQAQPRSKTTALRISRGWFVYVRCRALARARGLQTVARPDAVQEP